jgi:hypothetical protein
VGERVPELDEVYDDETLAALDRRAHRPQPRRALPRGRPGVLGRGLSAGAVLTAVALGLRDALESRRRVEIFEVDPWHRHEPRHWVRLRFDRDPRRTVAYVRSRTEAGR